MFSRSAQRLTTTLLVLVSLLFSQLALASFVCPPELAGWGGHEPMAMQMADGQPCAEMAGMQTDTQQPVLCHQHCVNPPQSFDPVQVPTLGLPAVVLVLVIPPLLDAGASEAVAAFEAGQARPPPAPLFLSTLRLRV